MSPENDAASKTAGAPPNGCTPPKPSSVYPATDPCEEDGSSTNPRAIPVPGHTRGHVVLLYRNKFLFTGDHLAWSDKRRGLIAFRDVAWYSWREQTKSMKRLLNVPFEWVLPGHGHRAHQTQDAMHQSLIDCIAWMEKTK